MQPVQALKNNSESLLHHSARVLASGLATSTRIHQLQSDLVVLRTSLEAYKQHIYSQLDRHEQALQATLASCLSHLYVEGKDLDSERSQCLKQLSLLEADLSALYVQVKGCMQRVQSLEKTTSP